MVLAVALGSGDARALSIAELDFESYDVASGGFLLAPSDSVSFFNNAGVVEPFSRDPDGAVASLSSGGLLTWSATFAAFQGEQYASTYGGFDAIRQDVSFPSAGDYLISVYAAAPDGSVTIGTTTHTLVQGTFAFTLDGFDVDSFQIDPGTDWTLFSATLTIPTSGLHTVGFRNTALAIYFINYDDFAIVPEPSSALLLALALPALALLRRRR